MRVLASRLRELKLKRGDQRRLAELAGVTQNSLIKWRKGLGNPRLSELESLAEAMRVSIVYLVSSTSAETPTLPGDVVPNDDRPAARVERLLRRAERVSRELSAATAAARDAKR
jgi:transcriptional regulator with XRE-family HTH domain